MQSFSTEFPVHSDTTGSDCLAAVKEWILSSRYTHFRPEHLVNLGDEPESKLTVESDSVEFLHVSTDDTESMAVTYHKRDQDCDWISSIVFSGTPSANWVSVRVMCEPHHPTAKLPKAKKPVLMKTLLTQLGGGQDGLMIVNERPHFLSENDIGLAASCILGTSRTYLPVVYISAPFHGPTPLDAEELAKKLAGMAHVLVEPSRAFSIRLMDEVGSQNVYGGAVGVYWPEGGGQRKFLNDRTGAAGRNLGELVFDEIRLALNNRRPLTRCTWGSVKELQSRRVLNELKDAGSTRIEEWVAAFDEEVAAKSAALEDAEREIQRLNAEIRRYEAQTPSRVGLSLSIGEEQDYFVGEISDIVIDALSQASSAVTEDSRRQHILKSIVENNPVVGNANLIRERLKGALRNYQGIDGKTQKELTEIGFALTDSGKHHKLTWNCDSRYTFTLAKTPSDHRTGLNSALDISRLFL